MKISSKCFILNLMSTITILTILIGVFFLSTAHALSECGNPYEGRAASGVADYTDPSEKTRNYLKTVEAFHFTRNIENLNNENGDFGNYYHIMGDLDYTLRHFPNHHRALYTVSRLERLMQEKSQQTGKMYIPRKSATGFPSTAECYFDRAIQFRPKDAVVHLLYAIHLQLSGKLEEAFKEYKLSEQLQPNSAELQYNFGLFYFERGDYKLAKQHAHKAYKLGYPLPGLRSKLEKIGEWP